MPFVPNTPEALLGRSDSKNPSETCRGITSSGRPCRRALAARPEMLEPRGRPKTPDLHDENMYCWQHKEQASRSAKSSPGPRGTATPILEGRTSIDTLTERLGLVDLQEKPTPKPKPQRLETAGGGRPPKTKPKPASTLKCCFCFEVPLEEVEQPRPRPARPQPRPVQRNSIPVPPSKTSSKQRLSGSSNQRLNVSDQSPSKASYKSGKSTASATAQLKSLIPDTLDPATASALWTEVARPYVDSEEPGFIYMFWLTPTSEPAPPVDAARSLLAPPSPRPRSRSPSDVVSSFTNKTTSTMKLKIGRANNVHRRMNEWSRQCGYDIEMLRYYPYVPGVSEQSGVVPRTMPHVKRVERLIHIELAGLGMRAEMGTCDACGRDHREWFEVEGTRDGIRKVDEVIRRWADWDENTT